FLGVGVQPPTPSWGSMLNVGKNYLDLAPWLAIAPGAAIFLSVIAFNVLGDAVRDALDPFTLGREAEGYARLAFFVLRAPVAPHASRITQHASDATLMDGRRL